MLREAAGSVPVELFHLERIAAILATPAMVDVRKQVLGIDFGEAGVAQRRVDLHVMHHCP